MRYKDILVHLDESKACADRIRVAVDLAKTHDGHVTGLYVINDPELPGSVLSLLPEETLAEQRQLMETRAEEAAARFRTAAEREGVSFESRITRSGEPAIASTVALHARYADLVVLGQVDRSNAEVVPAPPEDVLLASGRPALIEPYIGLQPGSRARVMIAWDAGREASRAVHDALPLLKDAEMAHILSVNRKSTATGHGEAPGDDIARHLARHGVRAEAERMHVQDLSVGDAILARVADLAIDLLVTGAYGHSRMRELVLGGVTRRLLQSMTVPVLMSH
jgi:nucleotide-binding universal stress UspA family protein